jgi:hypothetical protein
MEIEKRLVHITCQNKGSFHYSSEEINRSFGQNQDPKKPEKKEKEAKKRENDFRQVSWLWQNIFKKTFRKKFSESLSEHLKYS